MGDTKNEANKPKQKKEQRIQTNINIKQRIPTKIQKHKQTKS